VVLAQYPAVAGEEVLVQLAGLFVLAQYVQVYREIVGRIQGIGVVLAQYPAVAGKGVVVELMGLFVLAQRAQVYGENVGRVQCGGVVVAQHRATHAQCPFEYRPGGCEFSSCQHICPGVVEQPADVVLTRI